ncbi:MAG TPA: hypothetical protein VHK88_11805 [Aquihabitans sp.]|nr:hypothetical protein [Aquihabitans sp.]
MNRDQELLTSLDERAGSQAADLRRRAAARPAPAFDPNRPLGLGPVPSHSADAGVRRVAVAGAIAAALLVAGGFGWLASTDGGDRQPAPAGVTTGKPRPFVATDLPDGYEPTGAVDLRPGADGLAPMSVFGSSSEEPGLGVTVQPQFALDVVVAGVPVDLGDDREAFAYDGVGLGRRAVLVRAGDASLLLTSPVLDRAALVRVARSTVVERGRPGVDEAALPEGWTLLAEEPGVLALSSPVAVFRSRGSGTGSVASYIDSTGEPQDGTTGSVVVWSSEANPASIHAQELFTEGSEAVTVRGRGGLLSRYPAAAGSPSGWVLSWIEAPGEVVRVQASGVDRAEVLAVAEGVRPADVAEWTDLLERTQLGELAADDDQTGYEELGRGEFADGTPWRLGVATDGIGGTQLSVATGPVESEGASSGGSGSASGGGGTDAAFRTVDTLDRAGRHFASGLLGPATRTVALRRQDGTVIDEAVVIGEGDRRAWVAEITEDPTIAVALDDGGSELGRVTFEELDRNTTVDLDDAATTTPGG